MSDNPIKTVTVRADEKPVYCITVVRGMNTPVSITFFQSIRITVIFQSGTVDS